MFIPVERDWLGYLFMYRLQNRICSRWQVYFWVDNLKHRLNVSNASHLHLSPDSQPKRFWVILKFSLKQHITLSLYGESLKSFRISASVKWTIWMRLKDLLQPQDLQEQEIPAQYRYTVSKNALFIDSQTQETVWAVSGNRAKDQTLLFSKGKTITKYLGNYI